MFLKQLEAWRVEENLSHAAFAAMLGISPAQWSKVLAGKRRVSNDFAQRCVKLRPQLQPFWFADLAVA